MRRGIVLVAIVTALVAGYAGGSAWGVNPFVDIAGNVHADNIDAIYNAGVTSGCDATHYCPDNNVTRAQMATFLARVGGFGKGNLPKTNGRTPVQVFCGLNSLYNNSFPDSPCRGFGSFVDSTEDDGYEPSLAIGPDGLPGIAHHSTSGGIRFTHCETVTCSASTTVTVVATGDHPSLAFNKDGNPIIAFVDGTNHVSLARCNSPACTVPATVTTVSATLATGQHRPSLAVSNNGFEGIAFYDATNKNLEYARCPVDGCTQGVTFAQIDTTGNTGEEPFLTYGADDNPVFSYYDVDSADLRVAVCSTPNCIAGIITTNTLDAVGDVGRGSSIAIGLNGVPVISYLDVANHAVKVAYCEAADCDTIPTITTVGGTDTFTTSIATGSDGLPLVAYRSSSFATLLQCANIRCTSSDDSALPPTLNSGNFASMAIGMDGQPVIAHRGTGSNVIVSRPAVR